MEDHLKCPNCGHAEFLISRLRIYAERCVVAFSRKGEVKVKDVIDIEPIGEGETITAYICPSCDRELTGEGGLPITEPDEIVAKGFQSPAVTNASENHSDPEGRADGEEAGSSPKTVAEEHLDAIMARGLTQRVYVCCYEDTCGVYRGAMAFFHSWGLHPKCGFDEAQYLEVRIPRRWKRSKRQRFFEALAENIGVQD